MRLTIVIICLALLATGIHARIGDAAAASTPSTVSEKTHSHIYFLLDRSGSMAAIADDVIGGINAFIADQKREAADANSLPTFLSLIQFDSQEPFELCHDKVAIADVEELTSESFQPRSMTPLHDAIGSVVTHASKTQEGEDKSLENVVVVVFSDGQENASREFSQAAVFELIEKKKAEGWAFVFLGANQDAYKEGSGYGTPRGNTQNFAFDKGGVDSALASLSRSTSSMNKKLFDSARMRVPSTYESSDFFEGVKEAEEDLAARAV